MTTHKIFLQRTENKRDGLVDEIGRLLEEAVELEAAQVERLDAVKLDARALVERGRRVDQAVHPVPTHGGVEHVRHAQATQQARAQRRVSEEQPFSPITDEDVGVDLVVWICGQLVVTVRGSHQDSDEFLDGTELLGWTGHRHGEVLGASPLPVTAPFAAARTQNMVFKPDEKRSGSPRNARRTSRHSIAREKCGSATRDRDNHASHLDGRTQQHSSQTRSADDVRIPQPLGDSGQSGGNPWNARVSPRSQLALSATGSRAAKNTELPP
ncbi:unnamed protein product [Ixodes persulcatus]